MVAAWTPSEANVATMHMMKSALMHRTAGFASFLRFRVFAMFPSVFVFIFLSLPESRASSIGCIVFNSF